MNEYFNKLTFYMLLAMFLWGGGWTALKILTLSVSLEVVTFWRFLIMFLAFIPLLVLTKRSLVISKKSFKFIIVSACLNIIFMVLAFLGIEHGLAGSGGVIITVLSPLFTFVLVILLMHKKTSKRERFGILLGILGGLIMLELFSPHGASLILTQGNLYYLLAALIWAFVTLLSQRSHLHIHPIIYSFYISGVATTILFFLTYKEDLMIIFDQGLSFWTALLYLAILGQTVATTIYYYASGILGSAKASSFMFVVPLSALFISHLFLDEPINFSIVLGGAITLVAIYLINKSRHLASK